MEFGINALAERISNIILYGRNQSMTEREFYELEIGKWRQSPQRIMQIKGQLYYENIHDILTRKRTMIGDDGKLQVVENLPNNRIIDNQYAKLVNQKTNYIVGQPFVLEGENEAYVEALKQIFDKGFMKTLKNAVKSGLNNGIAWLYPYYTEEGKFAFRLFPGYEVRPYWKDSEHTILDSAIRLYLVQGYEGRNPVIIEKVEIYDKTGIHRFTYEGEKLVPDVDTPEGGPDAYHITTVDASGVVQGFNWQRIPLIPIKYNEQEIPLLKKVKSLQDGINVMLSDFENNMQEDARNTIIVLKNYDGTNLGEFRRNLATFGAVKVRYDGDTKGGVETLQITVNAENYKSIVEIFKKAMIENGMGFDAKDDRLSGTPNQMNIQSMYSDIDLDANDMETELQAAFENILWFVNAYLANAGTGDFTGEDVTITFNRDMMMDEGQIITNIQNSTGILSKATLVAQHPWVDDVEGELSKIEEEEQKAREDMFNQAVFPNGGGNNPFQQKQGGAADGKGGVKDGDE